MDLVCNLFLLGIVNYGAMCVANTLSNSCINPKDLHCSNDLFQSALIKTSCSFSICFAIVMVSSLLWKNVVLSSEALMAKHNCSEEEIKVLSGPIDHLASPLREKVIELKGRIDRNEHFNPYHHLNENQARDLCYYLWDICFRNNQIPLIQRLDRGWGQNVFQYGKYNVQTLYKREALLRLADTYKA